MITYDRTDLTKFPSRQEFGNAVADAFNFGASSARIEYWACCFEKHTEGANHHHACVKLSATKGWLSGKNYLSDDDDNYCQAYNYVSKSDTAVYHSPHHHNLDDISPPRTAGFVRSNRHGQIRNSTNEAGE